MITWALLAIVVVTAVLYSRWRHNYWSRKGVLTPPGCVPFFGHIKSMLQRSKPIWISSDEAYKKYRGSKFCGSYLMHTPSLFICDPEIAKAIFIKDFDHFVDRRTFKMTNSEDKVFNEMLTVTTGSHWKGVRSVLTTSFTSGRMKGMFPLVATKADDLVQYVQKQTEKDSVVLMKKSFGLYTIEVISSCAFGLETDSFQNEDSEFLVKARDLFTMNGIRLLKILFFIAVPKLAQMLKLQVSHPNTGYFTRIVKEMMKQRLEGVKRGDFLDIMMETREEFKDNTDKKKPKYVLSDETIVGSAMLFILAGFDNTANTLAFSAFLLSKHSEFQERLRDEMKEVVAEYGTLTYQGIMEAKFLDACISETLRLYPPGHTVERKCTKEYKIPGTDVVVPEGMVIAVPIWSLHHDERFWSEPMKFDPTRFLPENKDNIVSGTYLPFGVGPRNCIAMRFAQMEMKMALAKLVLEFDMQCPPGQEEIELSKDFGVMRPKDDVPLILTPLAKE